MGGFRGGRAEAGRARSARRLDEICAAAASPCKNCSERPCLSACPVGAFSEAGYDVPACAGDVRAAEGRRCRVGGCLARAACPVGSSWRYPAEAGVFHLAAFARNHLP
jgi:Fe-S-cluster-containing hydrogenase component 2